jgi:hypothetical protein
MSTNQLLDEIIPGLGHNRPPLGEQIAEALLPLCQRQAEILASAGAARIENDVDAQAATDLVVIMRTFERDIDAVKDEIKAPYLAACRLIENNFGAVKQPVTAARVGGVLKLLDGWRRHKEAEPRAAGSMDPIRSDLGTVGTRRNIVFKILDLRLLIGWMLRGDLRTPLEQAASTLVDRHLRSLGVKAVEQGGAGRIPGLDVRIEHTTTVRS